MALDPERALIFGGLATSYDQWRPAYPQAALDWLLQPGARRVADVGAGTGKLTESLPVRDASVDGVIVGQAWHWFDQDKALSEARRVTRPGGWLSLVWNGDTPHSVLQLELARLDRTTLIGLLTRRNCGSRQGLTVSPS